jgi:hypothetical protein
MSILVFGCSLYNLYNNATLINVVFNHVYLIVIIVCCDISIRNYLFPTEFQKLLNIFIIHVDSLIEYIIAGKLEQLHVKGVVRAK